MKVNYILSDTTKSATTSALKEVLKKAESDMLGTYVVLVPETKSIIIEKELLSLSKNGAFANVYVYSFVRLINRLGFVSSDKIVSKQSCVMLLRKIVFDNFERLKCYQKTAKTVGFVEKIYDTIQQFKSSNITPNDLKSKVAESSNALKAKLEDIVFLYDEYEKSLGLELYDDCDKLNLISKFAKTSEFVKNSEFFVVGFDNVTFEMTSVLKDLAINAKETTFSCCYFNEKRSDKYIQSNDLYKKFKHIADELKIPYVPTFVSANKKGDFYYIQNSLFATDKKTVKSKGNVQIFEALSKKQEIDFIANQILIEIDQGKRFKDIGLFVCSLDSSLKLIEDCFKAYEIPYFVNRQYDISSHALIKFIQACFELEKSHLSSEKVLKFLSSPFVDVDDYSVYENYVNASGVNYGGFLEPVKAEDFNKETDYIAVTAVTELLYDFYKKFNEIVSNSTTVKDFVKAVDFVFDYFKVSEKLDKLSVFEKENGLDVDAEITMVIFEKCNEFNKSFINFMAETKVSLDEFLQIYLTGFSSIKLNLSPVSIDCVIIQENTDGFFDIKSMYIMGAEDGKFPGKLQDSGIILDNELEETKQLISKQVEPTVKEINERELFRTYEALLEPKDKLVVSYALTDVNGSQNRPARILLRLLSLFGEEIKTTSKNGYKKALKPVKSGYELKFAKHVNKYLNDEFLHSDLNKEFNVLKNKMSEPLSRFIEQLKFGDKTFEITGVQDLYFLKGTTSISQLEKYFACPYLFYTTYGLKLKENKNVKLSSLDIGSIVHKVAELFVNGIESFAGLAEDAFDEKVLKLCQRVYEEFNVNSKNNNAILNFITNESKRLCKHLFYEQEISSFKNNKTLNEYSFRGDNAVKLQLDDGNVILIEGKIDRIDEWGNYIRIIDYKTGDIKSDLTSVYYGKKIQLISYLMATEKFRNKNVAGLFYFPIHSDFVKNDKKIKDIYKLQGFLIDDANVLKHMDNAVSFDSPESHLIQMKIKTNKDTVKTNNFELNKGRQKIYFSNDEFDDLKSYNEILCKTAVQEILSGYAEPSPMVLQGEDEGMCKWCELAGFCGLEKSKFKNGRKCFGKVDIDSFNDNLKGGTNE